MKRPAGILKNTLKKVSAQKAALKKVPTQKPALKKAAKGKVNTNNLKQLGEMSLKEKVQAIAEEHSDEEAGALALVETMTKAEKSNAWNQHMTSLRKDGNESLKKDFEQLSKNEKGKATALFLMQKHKPVFGSVSKSASKTNSLKKREKWMSEKEAYEKWSEQELKLHLDSGRVLWRECPDTWGVNEYLDTKDYEKTTTGQSTSHWQYGQEYEVVDEEMEGWEQALETDLQTLMLTGLDKGNAGLEKGKGKGKGLEKGKGKGKKTKPIPNKGEEEDPLEDLTQEEALKKVRKTKALLLNTVSNFEKALKKVEKSPYLSKQSLKDKQAMLKSLEDMVQATKKILEKGGKNTLAGLKKHLLDAVACMKDAKDEAKELVQLSMKALSKASK